MEFVGDVVRLLEAAVLLDGLAGDEQRLQLVAVVLDDGVRRVAGDFARPLGGPLRVEPDE